MGTLGALITAWVTFVPSFLFILAGAPFVERLAESPRARMVLDTVTAAVIGVIANLAAWFAAGVFAPDQPAVLHAVITGVSLWLLVGRGWSIPSVVGIAAAAGLLRAFLM
jgi:chromate transporter